MIAAAGPTGAGFTVVLVLHVAAALVGIVTLAASELAALRLLAARRGPVPGAVRSFFSPGQNWAGRVLYVVPVLGGVLVAMSNGRYDLGDDWVVAGIGLWVAAIGLCEAAVWPAERRVHRALVPGARADPAAAARACRALAWSAASAMAVLVAAMVVMVAKP